MGVVTRTMSSVASASIASRPAYQAGMAHFCAVCAARSAMLSATAVICTRCRASARLRCGSTPRCATLPQPTNPARSVEVVVIWSILSFEHQEQVEPRRARRSTEGYWLEFLRARVRPIIVPSCYHLSFRNLCDSLCSLWWKKIREDPGRNVGYRHL